MHAGGAARLTSGKLHVDDDLHNATFEGMQTETTGWVNLDEQFKREKFADVPVVLSFPQCENTASDASDRLDCTVMYCKNVDQGYCREYHAYPSPENQAWLEDYATILLNHYMGTVYRPLSCSFPTREEYSLEHCNLGFNFVVSGKEWRLHYNNYGNTVTNVAGQSIILTHIWMEAHAPFRGALLDRRMFSTNYNPLYAFPKCASYLDESVRGDCLVMYCKKDDLSLCKQYLTFNDDGGNGYGQTFLAWAEIAEERTWGLECSMISDHSAYIAEHCEPGFVPHEMGFEWDVVYDHRRFPIEGEQNIPQHFSQKMEFQLMWMERRPSAVIDPWR